MDTYYNAYRRLFPKILSDNHLGVADSILTASE